jgi:hypothetical protein
VNRFFAAGLAGGSTGGIAVVVGFPVPTWQYFAVLSAGIVSYFLGRLAR